MKTGLAKPDTAIASVLVVALLTHAATLADSSTAIRNLQSVAAFGSARIADIQRFEFFNSRNSMRQRAAEGECGHRSN